MVFLWLPSYRQQTIFCRGSHKLASRFYSPYSIKQCIGKVAYKLKLPKGSRIHPIFHVSLLNKKVRELSETTIDLPLIDDDKEIIQEPEAILDTHWVRKGSHFVEESLVKWKRLPQNDATWEDAQELKEWFLNQEDRSVFLRKIQGSWLEKHSKDLGWVVPLSM